MWNSACRWARPRLSLLAGDELSGEDRRRAERHLIVCAECRSHMESHRSSLGALRLLSAEAGPSTESPSLWPALARQIRESRHPEPATYTFRPVWTGLAIAAATLMAAGLATWGVGKARTAGETIASKTLNAKPRPPIAPPSVTDSSATVAEVAPSSHRPENEPSTVTPPTSPRKESGTRGAGIGVEATQ